MNKVIPILLPFYANKKINDGLRTKLADTDNAGVLSYVESSDKITLETLQEQYNETMRTKDKLEDKAKTNVAGITISITLIMGASGLLSNIYAKFSLPWVAWISFLLFSLSVIYMLIAGIMAIGVLISENEVYIVKLNSLAANSQILRDDYDKCIGLNTTKNLIRNNSVYTSYECIRNALICLFVLLVLVTIPFSSNKSNPQADINSFDTQNIVYLGSSVISIKDDEWQSEVEQTIAQAKSAGQLKNNQTIGLLSPKKNLFIKVAVDEDMITVMLIEPIERTDPDR